MKQIGKSIERVFVRRWCLALVSFWCFCIPFNANATVVEFQTSLGNFEVNLTDEATPGTVANFLQYVADGDYINTVFHRSAADFVVQGGGFIVDVELPLTIVPQDAPIRNEPVFSSRRGTIAMAKLSTRVDGVSPEDSATSEWFFNLADNNALLDAQNGGFTVFGEVVGDGMDVIDAIAALPTYNFDGAINELPLRDYTDDDFTNEVPVDTTKLVVVSAIVITDAAVDTAVSLDLIENTVTRDFLENRASGIGLWLMLALTGLLVWRVSLFKNS